jgi:predicted outer membrane repeat protein
MSNVAPHKSPRRSAHSRASRALSRVGLAGLGLVFGLGLLVATAPQASAITNPTLYLDDGSSNTPTPGCTSATDPCTTLDSAIAAVDALPTSDGTVTLDVAYSSDYGYLNTSPDYIDLPSGDNLVMEGTGGTPVIAGPGGETGIGAAITIDSGSDGTVTIDNLAITQGDSGSNGGGIHDGSTEQLTVEDVIFDNNYAVDSGGAIEFAGAKTASLFVTDCQFNGNGAGIDGGAIEAGDGGGSDATLTIDPSVFNGNTAATDGGAIDSGDGTGSVGSVSDTGSQFVTNSAGEDGGAIDSGDNGGSGTLDDSGSTFDTNLATSDDGGAIDLGDTGSEGSSIDPDAITGDIFSGNRAGTDGGAIDLGDDGIGYLTVSGSGFGGNSVTADGSADDGGAIDAGDDDGTAVLGVTTTTFTGNTTPDGDGGAIDAQDGAPTAGSLTATDDTFDGGNDAGEGGAVATWFHGTIENSTLAGNGADFVGGGVVYQGSFTLVDDTISGSTGGDGIYGDLGSPDGTIADSILSGNATTNCGGGGIGDGGYNVTSDTSCDFTGTSITSSVAAIGLGALANNGSSSQQTEAITTASSAYQVVPTAACTISTDERGDPRPGTAETVCDAGAYEVQNTAPVTPPPPASGTVTLIQGNPITATVGNGAGYLGQLTVINPDGTVTYVEATSADSGDVVVSSTGAISASSSLPPGTYVVSGTDFDTSGDTGAWSFTLVVSSTATPTPAPPVVLSGPHGYWLVGSDGGIFSFGNAQFEGSAAGFGLVRPIVGISPTPDRLGYWLVASDGGVFNFGDAQNHYYGSLPGEGFTPAGSGGAHALNAPIVGMVPTADDGGYFLVGGDGGVFTFGDAKYEGSCPGVGGCYGAAVAVAPDASGNGYWVFTTRGDVYAFGDAANYGQPGPQSVPVVSAVRTPDGKGYWILFSNGAIASYGDAANLGAPLGGLTTSNPAAAIFATSDGGGYWVATSNGSVYNYGDAPNDGGTTALHLNGPIIAANGS